METKEDLNNTVSSSDLGNLISEHIKMASSLLISLDEMADRMAEFFKKLKEEQHEY